VVSLAVACIVQMMRASLRQALSRYDIALQQAPLRTKALTSSAISAFGDAVVQRSTNGGDSRLDVSRTARQVTFSAIISPVTHSWFKLLALVPSVGPVPASMLCVLADQAVFSPPVHILYFAWTSAARSGFAHSLSEVKADVEVKLLPALKANLLVWPAAVYLNVTLVPLNYRVLFVNGVGLGYGMLMTWMAHHAGHGTENTTAAASPDCTVEPHAGGRKASRRLETREVELLS